MQVGDVAPHLGAHRIIPRPAADPVARIDRRLAGRRHGAQDRRATPAGQRACRLRPLRAEPVRTRESTKVAALAARQRLAMKNVIFARLRREASPSSAPSLMDAAAKARVQATPVAIRIALFILSLPSFFWRGSG